MKRYIRKAEKKDIEEIVKLLFELTSIEREMLNLEPPLMNEVSSRVNLDFIYKKGIEYFVCDINNEIVGVIRIEKFMEEAKISEAFVKKEYRNKGIMTLLFEKCVEWSKNNEVNELYLTIVQENHLAYNFWVNLGFYETELKNRLISMRKKVSKDIVK